MFHVKHLTLLFSPKGRPTGLPFFSLSQVPYFCKMVEIKSGTGYNKFHRRELLCCHSQFTLEKGEQSYG